jgi:hypothetical protein
MKKTIATLILILVSFVVYGQRPQRFQDGVYADANSVSYTVSGETEEGLPAVINVGPMEFKHYTNGYFAEIPNSVYYSLKYDERNQLERKVKAAFKKALDKRYSITGVEMLSMTHPDYLNEFCRLYQEGKNIHIYDGPCIEVKVCDMVKKAEDNRRKEKARKTIVDAYLNF